MPTARFSADQPEAIAQRLLDRKRRILLFGETGVGKSTLASRLAQCFGSAGLQHGVIGADPGSPAFGLPGAVCLGSWQGRGLRLLDCQALCTLNAGRFRLPLINAVRRVAATFSAPILLIDSPGVTRGVAGAELLSGLIDTAAVDTVLLVAREGKPAPLLNELTAAGVDIWRVAAPPAARPPKPRQRMRARTRLWDAHLAGMPTTRIALCRRHLLGTPPPVGADRQWCGRQIALLEKGRTIAMGEVLTAEEGHLVVRLSETRSDSRQLLVRDAGRIAGGGLGTAAPPAPRPAATSVPPDCLPRRQPTAGGPVVKVGRTTATLLNGVFGDPLLHLRLHNRKRSLLFDLGEGGRLPARIIHQVSDVFITHAHVDHIGGFLWLLRSRIGEMSPCRLYGPPGLALHIAGMVDGIRWDRIGSRGPVFEILELHGDHLDGYRLQAGREGMATLGPASAPNGLLVDEPAFTIRGVILDHGIPVLALALEQKPRYRVSKQALRDAGYPPGPWLRELKQRIAGGVRGGACALPDGRSVAASRLAEDLIRFTPGEKIAYATDLADTRANREKLTALARGARVFFCEAAFIAAHQHLAVATGHLTARACGEIAADAGVESLVPFHLSRRYDRHPDRVVAEISGACPGVAVVWQANPASRNS